MNVSPLRAIALASCVLLLSGCTPVDEPPSAADEPIPQAGQCLAESVETMSGELSPDHTSTVACTELHRYVVVAAISVPDRLLSGETAEELLQNRAELLGADATTAREYDSWASRECESALSAMVGIDALTVAGVDAETARLTPVGAFTTVHSLTEEPHWAAGVRSLVCTVRWLDPTDASTSASFALPSGVQLTQLFTEDFPIEARQCLVHTDGTPTLSGCSTAHSLEPFLAFDAEAVFDGDWVAEVDPSSVSADQYSQLDAACNEVLDFALGGQNSAVAARAELMHTGWFDDSVEYRGVYCALAPAQHSRFDVEGSLIGLGDAEPQLVAAP